MVLTKQYDRHAPEKVFGIIGSGNATNIALLPSTTKASSRAVFVPACENVLLWDLKTHAQVFRIQHPVFYSVLNFLVECVCGWDREFVHIEEESSWGGDGGLRESEWQTFSSGLSAGNGQNLFTHAKWNCREFPRTQIHNNDIDLHTRFSDANLRIESMRSKKDWMRKLNDLLSSRIRISSPGIWLPKRVSIVFEVIKHR